MSDTEEEVVNAKRLDKLEQQVLTALTLLQKLADDRNIADDMGEKEKAKESLGLGSFMALDGERRNVRISGASSIHGGLRTNTRNDMFKDCLLYTSPSPRDKRQSRMPSSA